MKKLILIVAAMAAICLTLKAEDFAVANADGDMIYYNVLSQADKTVEVTYKGATNDSFDEYTDTINIPSTVEKDGATFTITAIGPSAMYYSSVASVSIPNTVTIINAYAFKFCRQLTSVTIPNSVVKIGDNAFGNTSLSSITIPKSLIAMARMAFYNCKNLKTLNFNADSCTEYSGFSDSPLTNVNIGSNVKIIPSGFLTGQTLLDTITIPNSVTSIGSFAFNNCTKLISFTIPNSVTSIGSEAFENTAWLNNQPNGEVYINNILYKYKGFSMPSNTSITVKDGTTSISDRAFYGWTEIATLTLPSSLTNIGENAFASCTNIDSIILKAEVPPILGEQCDTWGNCYEHAFDYSILNEKGCKIKVPTNSIQAYMNDKHYDDSGKCYGGWGKFTNYPSITVTITFDANSGAGTMTEQEYAVDEAVMLNANTFTKQGHEFKGWVTSSDDTSVDYEDKGEYTFGSTDFTLYAVWQQETSSSNTPEHQTLNIYPNPVVDVLYVESSEEISHIEIYNAQGKLTMNIEAQDTKTEISVEGLIKGIYVLQAVLTNGEVRSSKIVINN